MENHAGTVKYLPYDADTFATVTQDEHILNHACFLRRVGGTQQVHEQEASISRFARRTLVRNDLITDTDTVALRNAAYESQRKGLNTLRVLPVNVSTSDRGDLNFLVAISADLYAVCNMLPPTYETTG